MVNPSSNGGLKDTLDQRGTSDKLSKFDRSAEDQIEEDLTDNTNKVANNPN